MVIKRAWLLDPDWLKLLSNEVIAKISCRSRLSDTMASRFAEADEEFNEELGSTSENKTTRRRKKDTLLD